MQLFVSECRRPPSSRMRGNYWKPLPGPVIAQISVKQLQSSGWISKSKCQFIRFKHTDYVEDPSEHKPSYSRLYQNQIVDNGPRNRLLSNLTVREAKQDNLVLLFVDRIQHGHILAGHIIEDGSGLDLVFLSGKVKKEVVQHHKRRAEEKQLDILIVTRKLFGEGVDIPAVDVLINAAAGRSNIVFVQNVRSRSSNQSWQTWTCLLGYPRFRPAPTNSSARTRENPSLQTIGPESGDKR